MRNERRKNKDRRVRDYGPPKGWAERRKQSERRLPEVAEAELSADHFAKYFGSSSKISTPNDSLLDLAAEVFDRVRDKY